MVANPPPVVWWTVRLPAIPTACAGMPATTPATGTTTGLPRVSVPANTRTGDGSGRTPPCETLIHVPGVPAPTHIQRTPVESIARSPLKACPVGAPPAPCGSRLTATPEPLKTPPTDPSPSTPPGPAPTTPEDAPLP